MSFRFLLIYPPASRHERGAGDLRVPDLDRIVVPYGLLTIAAHLRAHGIEADVVNLCTFTWAEALDAIAARPADVFGLSCYTFNREATAALAAEIKARFPDSHVTAGGPFVSALPLESLAHYRALDTVVIGEGEATALELAERVRDGRSMGGLAGAARRVAGEPVLGPPRAHIADLDSVGKPWEHFDYAMPVTSRGCPGQCTFCGSPRLWGRKIRFRSAESVLEEIEELVGRRGHRVLRMKDDTFTAHRKRVLAVCEGIVERGLEFRWTCDTRVDSVGPEVLAAMRRAGCMAVSFGIESASPDILRNIRKRTSLDQALAATAAARDLGMGVRFYLMAGNRGETPATVQQTLKFVEQAQPTDLVYYVLTIEPGTEEFDLAREEGLLSADDYFAGTRREFFFNRGEDTPGMRELLDHLVATLGGKPRPFAPYSAAELERVLARHPDKLLSYTDLADAYCAEARLDDAAWVLRSAANTLDRESPLLLHRLACVSLARCDVAATQHYFGQAVAADPANRRLHHDLDTLAAAGTLTPKKQARIARRLLERGRSAHALLTGQPAVPALLAAAPPPPVGAAEGVPAADAVCQEALP